MGRANEAGIQTSVLRVLAGEGRMREKEVEIRCKIEGNLKNMYFYIKIYIKIILNIYNFILCIFKLVRLEYVYISQK